LRFYYKTPLNFPGAEHGSFLLKKNIFPSKPHKKSIYIPKDEYQVCFGRSSFKEILLGFVTGHDFSRAGHKQKQGRALAPAIVCLPQTLFCRG
jgi:hypothetical protein